MRYMRAYQFVFDNRNWLMNFLFGIVCQLIPVIGPLVFLGYSYDVIEAMHRHGDKSYPDFDFNRFLKYLVRGVWPFLVQLIVAVPVLIILGIFWVVLFVSMIGTGGGKNIGWFLGLFAVLFLLILVLSFLVSLVAVPLALRAGLGQEFSLSLDFLKDFWKRVFKELLLAQLFLLGSALVLVLVGYMLCFVGVYPAAVWVSYAQLHVIYQLYDLYLQRGGTAIPLKLEAVED